MNFFLLKQSGRLAYCQIDFVGHNITELGKKKPFKKLNVREPVNDKTSMVFNFQLKAHIEIQSFCPLQNTHRK